jgi:hypothetical protein
VLGSARGVCTREVAGLAEARIEEQRQHMATTHPSRRKWEIDALDHSIKTLQLTRYRERLITERRARTSGHKQAL